MTNRLLLFFLVSFVRISAMLLLYLQVAVPPSAKALNWFCSQPESSGVFPLFFLSKEMNSPTCKSLYLNTARGVFGIGAAVSFTNSSCAPAEQSSIKRLMLFLFDFFYSCLLYFLSANKHAFIEICVWFSNKFFEA